MRRPQWLQDPVAPSLLVFSGLVLGGFVAIAIGWKVAARTLFVPFQVPALVSGGIGGLALIAIGVVLANVQVGRRLAAKERVETEELLDEAAGLMDAMRGQAR